MTHIQPVQPEFTFIPAECWPFGAQHLDTGLFCPAVEIRGNLCQSLLTDLASYVEYQWFFLHWFLLYML